MPKIKLQVDVEDVSYSLTGAELLECIQALGLTQAEFARECKFTSARIAHLVHRPTPVILKESGVVHQTLIRLGVDVDVKWD